MSIWGWVILAGVILLAFFVVWSKEKSPTGSWWACLFDD